MIEYIDAATARGVWVCDTIEDWQQHHEQVCLWGRQLMDIGDLMDGHAVARRLEVTLSAVHRLAARGTLASTWFAGRRVWRREQIERYLADPELQARRRGAAAKRKRASK